MIYVTDRDFFVDIIETINNRWSDNGTGGNCDEFVILLGNKSKLLIIVEWQAVFHLILSKCGCVVFTCLI